MHEGIEEMIKGILHGEPDKKAKIWKAFYYEFHDLIDKDGIFSKLPNRLMNRLISGEYRNFSDKLLNFFKIFFMIPVLLFWKIFLTKFEYLYHKRKYPEGSMPENIKDEDFDFLFVLNTRDHIITALPVLEKMNEMGKKILIVTFKEVYSKYRGDFNKLKNAKFLFFEYELKNLPVKEYIEILYETKNKFEILKSHKMDNSKKKVLQTDSSFVKLHLKEELIQYHFFKKIFDSFDLDGVVSIVFTTAFEIAKEKNIPTFILQHGIGGAGLSHWPYMSNYIIAYDDLTKKEMDKWLDNTVTILPLGAPRFEYLKKVASSKRNISDFNKKIGCSGYKKNVTYIDDEHSLLALKKLRQKLPDDINLVIKLHPRYIPFTKEDIENVFSKNDLEKTTVIKEIDFYETVANSDVVIATTSTGMLESIAMDIPTLQVNFTGQSYPKQIDLSSFGWKEPISEPEVMVNEVLSILSDMRRYEEVIKKQEWLKTGIFKNFGNCSKIIAEKIVSICESKREK